MGGPSIEGFIFEPKLLINGLVKVAWCLGYVI